MVIAMYILNNYVCLYFFNYICIRFRKIPQLDNVFKYCKIYVFIYKKYFLGKYILALSFVFSKNNMEKKIFRITIDCFVY